ncbi:hypothetical protein X566_14655 [Afipia sp. P52-10]|nr:hypothetical protein X566_14655 [Afipia sp. P52-10]
MFAAFDPALARGDRDHGMASLHATAGHGAHAGRSGGRHGNGPYTQPSSEEFDSLLSSKLKSIGRGC